MRSFVYVLENLADDSTCYVGKANDPKARFDQHCREYRNRKFASHLYNAMKKYGIDCWNLYVVEEFENEFLAYEGEREWISYLRLMKVRLYNLTRGGYGGSSSEDSNLKRSQTLKGRIPWNKGKTLSEETKKKQSEAHLGSKMPPRSEEWKLKQRNSQRKAWEKRRSS